MAKTYLSQALLNPPDAKPVGAFVDLEGERYYRISNVDAMAPFLMSLVSESDHWLFVSSNGALTAGRQDPDHALFPYYTDDRIHDSQEHTGCKTILRVNHDAITHLWEPFSEKYAGLYRTSRNVYKHVYGHRLRFEEVNHDLGLSFSYQWMTSDRFGFVRRAELQNTGRTVADIALVDGLQNVLPCGVGRRFQLEFSTLVDGYKRTELLEESGLALFRLSSIPVDRAEPSEALYVNLAWSLGLAHPKRLLSSTQLERFRLGHALETETDVRGRRGAYFVQDYVRLAPGESRRWFIVSDVKKDVTNVRRLHQQLQVDAGLATKLMVELDVERSTRNLKRIVGTADGLQCTADESNTYRHFSNTLFNVMRGGIPDNGYWVTRKDVEAYFAKCNRVLAKKHARFFDSLPETLLYSELQTRSKAEQDLDLERLTTEYLPLTFSRRHGDPSRPWNIFNIQLKDEQGQKLLNYEGNWRDLFQNWEALAHSFPGFAEGMIFKFLNASTADGYNPYRVTREGFDWEVSDPEDPWSFIGYWGDHQVIYLLKLMEVCEQHFPGRLSQRLSQRIFTYASVPYRIKPYEKLLINPRDTIVFDVDAHEAALKNAKQLGSDGKVLGGTKGTLVRGNLAEKLLLVVLAKLSNFIPEAGIWMNTQRPEWNDANNALVGAGVSMVTLYYLRRFVSFVRKILGGTERVTLASELALLLREITGGLRSLSAILGDSLTTSDRKRLLDVFGNAGTKYRQQIYQSGFSGAVIEVSAQELRDFFALAIECLDHSIRANRRDDGLYHAYNLMANTREGIEIARLDEMLEGQVAALSSGTLSVEESLTLLDALRQSRLYRVDQASYMLYPDRALPRFLEKNNLPKAAIEQSALLTAMLKCGDCRIVVEDIDGGVHFNGDFRNSELLKNALDDLSQGPYAPLVAQEKASILELYEAVFLHQFFTGRSGTFYKYEGLGCIYWHMVSKLLLAVDEIRKEAQPVFAARLRAHFSAIHAGLGAHKTPIAYGAFPTDPYSHTPSFAGVQQPGMTGQVKEDLITRFSEFGLHIELGQVGFVPSRLHEAELLIEPTSFEYVDLAGAWKSIELKPHSLAFTLCQVPVVVHRCGKPRLEVTRNDETRMVVDGLRLDRKSSLSLFNREGVVRRLDVFMGLDD